jgi:hypothetical protein
MRIVVEPSGLRAAAARIRADAASIEVLLVVARLEAAAASVAGSDLAAAAMQAAESLRAALLRARLQIAACATHLDAAADAYESSDAAAGRDLP